MTAPASRNVWALRAAEGAAGLVVFPLVALYRARVVQFPTVSTGLALIPGQGGRMLRRAWYARTLAACGRRFVVDFGGAIRDPRSRVGDDCYVGVYSWMGWVELGDGFLSGSHVVVLSGMRQHGFAELDVAMHLQGGEHQRVSIGPDVWVGTHAVIGADVAAHSVVAAGAVVNRTHEPYAILGGVPAKPIADRREPAA